MAASLQGLRPAGRIHQPTRRGGAALGASAGAAGGSGRAGTGRAGADWERTPDCRACPRSIGGPRPLTGQWSLGRDDA